MEGDGGVIAVRIQHGVLGPMDIAVVWRDRPMPGKPTLPVLIIRAPRCRRIIWICVCPPTMIAASVPSSIASRLSAGVVAVIGSSNERGEPWKQSSSAPPGSVRAMVGAKVRTYAQIVRRELRDAPSGDGKDRRCSIPQRERDRGATHPYCPSRPGSATRATGRSPRAGCGPRAATSPRQISSSTPHACQCREHRVERDEIAVNVGDQSNAHCQTPVAFVMPARRSRRDRARGPREFPRSSPGHRRAGWSA